MKQISFKQTDSARFNLDSLREKLLLQEYDLINEQKYEEAGKTRQQIDEIETLLEKCISEELNSPEWNRIQELVNIRKYQRYICCVNSGMNEQMTGYAFDD